MPPSPEHIALPAMAAPRASDTLASFDSAPNDMCDT